MLFGGRLFYFLFFLSLNMFFSLFVELPCKHAQSCISYLRLDNAKYYDHYCIKACYYLTYADIIHPVLDLSMVEIHQNHKDIV